MPWETTPRTGLGTSVIFEAERVRSMTLRASSTMGISVVAPMLNARPTVRSSSMTSTIPWTTSRTCPKQRDCVPLP